MLCHIQDENLKASLGFVCCAEMDPSASTCRIQMSNENWVDGIIIRAHYLNSTISSLLKPEFTVNQSLAPEVHGNRALPHCSHCPLISRHRRRFTENYNIKGLCPHCLRPISCIHSSMDTIGRWVTFCRAYDPGHTRSTIEQPCLMWSPDSC
jgi:hypothetical protein